MKVNLELRHIVTMIIGAVLLINDFLFFYPDSRWFKPLIAVGLIFGTSQFVFDFLKENKRQKEIEVKFLEFSRALVNTVKSGIPIPKAIIQISTADYGALSYYVKKLANQIQVGIPLRDAFNTFAKDTNNKIIIRSISIVREAEKSGGNIDEVLRAVTNSLVQVKKIKEERRANAYTQIVQGYFVFFVFIMIMLVLQIYLLPQLSDIGGALQVGLGKEYQGFFEEGQVAGNTGLNFDTIFISLTLIQGLFAGLLIGKFSEGELKMGIKHSLILMIMGYLLITTIRGF